MFIFFLKEKLKMYESNFIILERIKRQIINQYNQKGLKASGYFERNISIGRQGRFKVVLTLPYYSQYITAFKSNKGGVKKAPGAPYEAIEQWIKDKGLQLRDFSTGQFKAKTANNYKQAAFLISRKIWREGTDIYSGKRQPIDLDEIIGDSLDFAQNEMADRILQETKWEQ